MTRHRTLAAVLGPPLAVLLLSCGGGLPGADEAAEVAAASDADEAAPPGTDDAEAPPRPGGPDPGDGGGRPGAPFDIEAFENIGGPLENFRDTVASTCGGGACEVVEEIVVDPDAPEGCSVRSISYDPPARPEGAPPSEQFIQRGTHVTAVIACPPEDGATDGGATDGEGGEEPGEQGGEPAPDPEDGEDSGGSDGEPTG